jgi:TrkA domain protein
MEVEAEETRLPGIGLRHDFVTAQGRRIGVITQRNGVRHVAL